MVLQRVGVEVAADGAERDVYELLEGPGGRRVLRSTNGPGFTPPGTESFSGVIATPAFYAARRRLGDGARAMFVQIEPVEPVASYVLCYLRMTTPHRLDDAPDVIEIGGSDQASPSFPSSPQHPGQERE